MSFTTDPNVRQPFVTGLLDLADYLARHTHLVVPSYGTEILLHAASADDGGCAQVDRFARQLGVPVQNDLAYSGHYRAARSFGPVGYTMTAITDHAMARHHAHHSYHGCVTPEPDTWT
jgi:hypothetical protein